MLSLVSGGAFDIFRIYYIIVTGKVRVRAATTTILGKQSEGKVYKIYRVERAERRSSLAFRAPFRSFSRVIPPTTDAHRRSS